MHPRDELEAVRQRVLAVERELAELRVQVDRLERTLSPVAAAEPPSATFETPRAAAAAPAPVALAVEPPVLPTAPASTWPEPAAALVAAPAPLPPPIPPRESSLREWLEPLQLWPPRGEDNTEVRLAAWWTTRIGALLAVIGIVFLGLYVSRNSPPWVRLAEVAGVTVAVLALGSWLERKLPKFGAVLFGAGLALVYFCAFAAYAVAPMKVVDRASVAILCELAAVSAILIVAWYRDSQVVATMAIALGHVTAALALRDETAGFGPWVILLLGVAAVALRLARAWPAPSVLSLPLAWLFFAVTAMPPAPGMGITAAWFWAVLYFALYYLRDWLAVWRGAELTSLDRALQVTNATLGFAAGLFVTAQGGGHRLTAFYFGSAAIVTLGMLGWRQTGRAAALVSIFACKAAGLLALAVISAFEGQTRSLVLLVQAFVTLVSARQSSVRGLRLAAIVTAAAALAFFMAELRPEHAPLLVSATLVEVVFLAAAAGFVAALRRWLEVDAAKTAFAAAVVALAAISTSLTWATDGWTPACQIGLGLVVFLAAAALRSWLTAGVVGAMLLIAAHSQLWFFAHGQYGAARLWQNEGIGLLAAGVAGFALRSWSNARAQRIAHGLLVAISAGTLVGVGFKLLPATLALATGTTLSFALILGAAYAARWPLAALSSPLLVLAVMLFGCSKRDGDVHWLLLAASAAWAAAATLVAGGDRRLATIQTAEWRRCTPAIHAVVATLLSLYALERNVPATALPLAFAVAAMGVFVLAWRPGVRGALESSWVLWLAAIAHAADRGGTSAGWLAFGGAWLPALALVRVTVRGPVGVPATQAGRFAQGVQVAIASILGLLAAAAGAGANRIGGFGLLLLTGYSVWRWGGVRAASVAVLAFSVVGTLVAALGAMSGHGQGWTALLGATLAWGAAMAVLPFLIEREYEAAGRRRLRWSASVTALALVFLALARQRGDVADHATIGWGLAAVGSFLLGLFARSRPHRLVGLAGLALCVPRAFMVDLHSTLHRIAAFVALGVVLLWVGFSYHRFRHLVADDEKKL